MNKFFNRIAYGIVAVLLAVAVIGCGEGSALVGKWEEVEGRKVYGETELYKETIEFFKDRTVIIGSTKYEWKIDKGRIILSSFGSTRIYNYKISGSTLTLTDDRGNEEIYQKVKK